MACFNWAARRSCVVACELALQLDAGEPQRLELAHRVGVADFDGLFLGALARQFVHALLNSGVRIDQSFTSITHAF